MKKTLPRKKLMIGDDFSDNELYKIHQDEGLKDYPFTKRTGGRIYHHAIHDEANNPEQSDYVSKNPIHACYGFHGYVNKPTIFLAGEHGREHIDIYKSRKKHHENFWNVSEYFRGNY